MPQVLLDLPDDLLLALREQPEEILHEVRLIAAIHYLQAKRLSLGQAAQLAGVFRLDFLDLLAARGIPAFDLSAVDSVAEIAAAQRTTIFSEAPPACHTPPPTLALSPPSPGAGSPAPAPRHWHPIATPTNPLRGAH